MEYVPQAAIAAGLPAAEAPALLGYIGTGNFTGLATLPSITPTIIQAAGQAATKAYIKSYQMVYFVSIVFGVISIVASLAIDEKKMQEKMTAEVARKLQYAGKEKELDETVMKSTE